MCVCVCGGGGTSLSICVNMFVVSTIFTLSNVWCSHVSVTNTITTTTTNHHLFHRYHNDSPGRVRSRFTSVSCSNSEAQCRVPWRSSVSPLRMGEAPLIARRHRLRHHPHRHLPQHLFCATCALGTHRRLSSRVAWAAWAAPRTVRQFWCSDGPGHPASRQSR